MSALPPTPIASPQPRVNRPWAVTAITGLLLVEMLSLLGLAYINAQRSAAVGLVALALLALIAAIGFARLRRGGWVNAVLVQGGGLAIALYVYFQFHAAYSYPMMLGGILMVLYLHQADVLEVFRLAPGPEPGPP